MTSSTKKTTTTFDDAVAVDFPGTEWEAWTKPGAHGRVKIARTQGKRFRLLELPPGFDEHHWCLKGHDGYVLEGEFTILFEERAEPCAPGMAFCIPDGIPHRSRGAVNGPTVVVVVDKDDDR